MIDEKAFRFLNDVIKPFDELNEALLKAYVYEPSINDVVRMAGNLASAINHQYDFEKVYGKSISRNELENESSENKVISDVANMTKHYELSKKDRENSLSTASAFECRGEEFKFLRTIIRVEYNDGRTFDFMEQALLAINFWMTRRNFKLTREIKISEMSGEFEEKAVLRYEPSKSIMMNKCNVNFFRRNENGNLEFFDPEKVNIEFQNIR
jgi:hypothetical protein